MVTAEMVGWNKPDPQVFAFTRGRLSSMEGYGFDDILHVAQSQYHDIAVATAAGLPHLLDRAAERQAGAGATPVQRRGDPGLSLRQSGGAG
jgi:putative hydrolase of the HAD superfamily